MSESTRVPDDDLSFLGDLDQGLDLDSGYGEVPVRAPARQTPARQAPAPRTPAPAKPPPPASVATSRPRPLLALFPQYPPPPPIWPRSNPPVPAPALPGPDPAPARQVQPASIPLDRVDRTEGVAPTYETFYGLREKPFDATSDSRFLYHSAAHDRAAEELLATIGRRDGLAVLTGEAGIGKTMLCRGLPDRIDRRTFTAFVADPFVTVVDLLKAILFDFGVISRSDLGSGRLAQATRHELTVALHEFLLSLVHINGFAVMFIDDAHTVSPELLSEVQDIADTDRALMGIILIGQPELLLKVAPGKLTSGADRVVVRARLDPLAEDEIPGYVLHRLMTVATGRLSVEFDDAALALVHEISRGVPQLVNRLCDRALARGFEASVTLIDAPIVAAAARDLDLLAPEPIAKRLMKRVLAIGAIVGLVGMGSAAGAFVFRAQLTRAMVAWAAPPLPPPAPASRTMEPLATRPPPGDAPPIPGSAR